jgi:UDP-glucose 4-epimerase
MTEDSPVAAATPYAVSKLAGEQYTLMYHSLFEVPTTVVRYFNVYGPGERPGKYRNVVPNFIQEALSGRALIVTGTGAETREFC